MKKIKWQRGKWWGYVLYGAFLTVALFYYRFPSDDLRNYLEITVAKLHPGLVLSTSKLRLAFPPGLKFSGGRLFLKERPERPLFRADSLFVGPEFLPLLAGKLQYGFDCFAYGGALKGNIRFERADRVGPFTTSIRLEDIQIGDYGYFSSLIGRNIKGVMKGTVTYSGNRLEPMQGRGDAALYISEGEVQLLNPILSLQSIDFDHLSIKMSLKDRTLNLTSLELKGRTVQGELSGTIRINKVIQESRLDIQGMIAPLGELFGSRGAVRDNLKSLRQRWKGKGFSFVVRGTLGDPIFKFT
jgi:type II secretion system protein N